MVNAENILPCRHEFNGRCTFPVRSRRDRPSLAYDGTFVPLGEINGPGLATQKGLGCLATSFAEQEKCRKYAPKRAEDPDEDTF